MNKLFKSALCVVSVFVIVFSMFPLSAFAVQNPQEFSVSYNKPELTGNDFYVELLLFNPTTRDYHVKVFYFNTVPHSNYTPDIVLLPRYELRFFNDKLTVFCNYDAGLDFSYFEVEIYDNNRVPRYESGLYGDNDTTFSDSILHTDYGDGYSCINYHIYGNVASYKDNLTAVSGSPNTEFIVSYGETSSIYNTITALGILISEMSRNDSEHYENMNQLKSIIESIYAQDTVTQQHISDLLSLIRIMSADVILIREDLQKQYEELLAQGESISEIVIQLNQVNSYLNSLLIATNEIRDYTAWIWESSLEIQNWCEQIYNILNSGSDKEEPPTVDTSQFDNYYDVENELVGDGAADVEGAISVNMNNDAMSVIWNIVQRFVNSHEKVIGFILTILSFGLLALILGR